MPKYQKENLHFHKEDWLNNSLWLDQDVCDFLTLAACYIKNSPFDFKLSKTVSRRRHIGLFGLIVSIVAIISIFAYLSFYSNVNTGFIGNNTISNTHDLTNHSLDNNNHTSNLDDNTSSILVATWIGLMIVGSFLLYHIHFKVLPKE